MLVMETTVHPDVEKLRSFGQGRLPADDAAAVEEHLADCDSCCLLLEESPADSFVGRLRRVRSVFAGQSRSESNCTLAKTERTLLRRSPNPADTKINHAGRTPAPADDEPFELANHPRYRVVRLLGQGGMGAVYLAEHRHMGRAVALKIINPDLLNHPRSLPRFQQEVRAAAKLDHPNIVAAYDADHAASLHFLVMEYVEGQNLADYLDEKGPLPVSLACNIVRQAALGLQHAHERGMVHRDIKPHNLMLTPTNQVKVLDFGLARFAADPCGPNGDDAETMPSNLTGAGAVVGTTDYIAPEQAQDAHGADGRADIYSLGCTLYHLLTGKPPFPEGTASEKLRRHSAEEPRLLREQRTDVTEGLAAVVSRMMAKKPENRYQNSAEVAAALAPFITEAKPKRSKAKRILLALAGLAAVVFSGLVAAGVVRIPAGPGREIEIKTDDPNIEIIVKGDRIVRIIDPKTGKAYQLDRHDLTLGLADDPDGLSVTLDGKRPIQLKRHGKQIAIVRLQEASPARKADSWPIFTTPVLEDQCAERPTEQQVLKALGKVKGGTRADVRIEYEKIVDKIDPVRFYPLAGYARLHHIHWKCTVHFTEITESTEPFPTTTKRRRKEVLYIDKDHLHRDPQSDAKLQQAKKDLATAEFYERTHPVSAAFYYEIVCRRYPGTPYAEKAEKQLGLLPPKQAKDMSGEKQSETRGLSTVPKITPFRHITWSEGQPNRRGEISADGRYVLVIRRNVRSAYAYVRVWDSKTGKLVFERDAPLARFSADGTKLIICERWNDMHVYDLATGKKLRRFDADGQMYNFFPSPTGTGLIYLAPTSFQIWDWGTGEKLMQNPWNGVDVVAWAPDDAGHLLLQPEGKAPLHVLSSVTGKKENAYVQLRNLPTLPSNSLNTRFACLEGQKVHVYQKTSENPIATVDGGPDARGTISADGTRLLTTGNRRDELCLWDIDNERVSVTEVVHRAHLVAHLHLPESIDVNRLSLSLSRDGKYAVVGGPNDSSYVLRLTAEALAEHVGKKAHGEEQSEIPAAEKAVEILRKRWPGHEVTSGVEFSPDGRLLLSMHWGGVRVWEVSTGKVMYELEGWLGRFTMDGKHIITSAGADKNGNCLRLYDAHNGKLLRSFGKSPRAFWSLTMSADGRFVITNGDDNIGRLWDLKTGALVKSTPKDDLRPHNWDGPDVPAFQKRTGIGPIYLLPGGRQVLGSKPGDDQYGIYDLESGRLVRKLAASWKGLYGAASNYGCPLGYRMAFSYADGTICVLDLRSGKEVARFASGIFSPKCLAISADDRFVAACAGNEKSEVVVWRLPEPSQQVAKVRKMANGDDPEESESPADQPSWADKLFLAKGSTSHDFGTVAAGTQLKHRFRLKNIYSVPVEITSIRTSAGSAITCKESTRILKPNEEGYIDIKLDGRCFRGLKTVTIYVSVGPHYVSQARLQVTALAQEEADFSPESAFFNGKNLFGWQGLPGYWKVHNGAIVGAPADGIKRHTFLCSEKTYRDFELKFKVKRKGGIGNSGVQIRSTLVCAKQFVVTGPQIEIDSANHRFPPGSILIEPTGNPHIKANAAAVADVWKDEGFNDMTIRCEGKWVTVTINGVQVLDAPFPSMPAEGIIAWQLHGGTNGIVAPDEVIFKDIQFRELNKDQVRGPTPAEKKLVRHHFLDSSNWHGLKQFWTIKGGEIKGASDLEQPKDNTFLCSRRTYKDFELRFQVRVTGQGWAGNSGVQIRSTLIEPEKFIVRGPQCDIGESYWGCLYGERSGGMIKQASWEIGDRNVKEGQFNDYYIRCVGKHVTIKVNGLTTVDDKFPQLPEEGIIAWQLHGGKSMSVTFRNIEFKELVRPHTLFNGDMTGWIKEGGYPRTWQTENGELIGTATGYLKSGFILSPKSYTNFRLRFQYQLSAAANSGVALRAAPGEKEGQSQVPLHLEVQLLDDGAYLKPDGRMDCFTGALYWCTRGNTSLPPKHRAHFKAAGSWNEMEIELRGQRLQVWVNGRLVQDTDLDDLAFRADALPGLKRTAGRIGFQQHTGQVRFRNIQIEELSGPDASSTSTSGYRGVQVTPPDAVRLPRKSC